MNVDVRVIDHGIGQLMRHMTIAHRPAVKRAINRVVLDIREAEARMVASAFDFWSATTRQFLANERSFPFTPATDQKLVATVFTSPKTSEIMMRQEFGFTLNPNDRKRLAIGQSPASYAVPTKDAGARLRNARARVRPSETPAALLGIKGGGFARFKPRRRRRKGVGSLSTHVFITKNDRAIIEVTPSGGRRLLYGLYSRPVVVEEHTDFFVTAAKTVGTRLLPKLLQEWDRAFGRFGHK